MPFVSCCNDFPLWVNYAASWLLLRLNKGCRSSLWPSRGELTLVPAPCLPPSTPGAGCCWTRGGAASRGVAGAEVRGSPGRAVDAGWCGLGPQRTSACCLDILPSLGASTSPPWALSSHSLSLLQNVPE